MYLSTCASAFSYGRYRYKTEVVEQLKEEIKDLQAHLSQQEFRHTRRINTYSVETYCLGTG